MGTLRVKTAPGHTTKGEELTAEEADDNLLEVEDKRLSAGDDAAVFTVPVGMVVAEEVDMPLGEDYLRLDGGTYDEASFPELATYYTVTSGQFTVETVTAELPSGFEWRIKAK